MKVTLRDRIFIRIIKRLWNIYSCDPRELHRTNLKEGEPLFNADRFIVWLINFEYHEKVDKKRQKSY